MSGAEAIAILGIISSVVAIVDGAKQVYDAASNAESLPEAFREIAARLPIVQDILCSARRYIEGGGADEDVCKGARAVLKSCEVKAEKLKKLFTEVIPADGSSRRKRYLSAVKTLGKGSSVENLMKGVLGDVQLLAIEHGMVTETDQRGDQLAKAIKEVADLPTSLPGNATDDTGFTASHSGSGHIYQSQGEQFNNTGSGHSYHAQTMTFSSNGSEKDKATACLSALFQALGTDPRDDRNKITQRKGTRVNCTCSWILLHDIYKSWFGFGSGLLYLSGGPGKGKTMLSIFLIEEFKRIAESSPDVVFLEYFCDNKDEKRRTADGIVRGLLFQLLQLRPNLFPYVLPTFNIQKESLFSESSIESLWRIFKTIICDSMLGTIYCVLDGLDECDIVSLEVFLRHLKEVFSRNTCDSSNNRLKFIVVSRDLPEIIPESLSSFPRIQLDLDAENQVNRDVNRFIDVELDGLASYRHYPAPLYTKVKKVFQERGQGTFLWVGIVAKTLRRYKATEVEKALDLFPPGLEALYARMLLQIDDDRREVVANILRWVVLAARPLTLSELSAAIEPIGEPTSAFTRYDIIKDQVSHCGHFLITREDKVNIIHQSAKEYLLRKERDPNSKLEFFRVEEKVGIGAIARRCFYELQNGPFINYWDSRSHQKVTSYLEASPLRSYAVFYWPMHANSLSCSHDIFDLSLPFYRKESRARYSWITAYDFKAPFHQLRPTSIQLHIAAWVGILPLAEKLLTQKGFMNGIRPSRLINRKDSTGSTALKLAAQKGHLAMMELLLERGANIEARGWMKMTALIVASLFGHRDVVQLLLGRGANIEVKDVLGDRALTVASSFGHRDVVRLLLENGADIEAKDNSGGRALIAACRRGHQEVVQLLLENRADIEAKEDSGETALIAASESGHRDVVQLLLERGANIEAKNELGDRASIVACQNGHRDVVQLLLEKGADIEEEDGIDREEFIRLSQEGRQDVIAQLLVKRWFESWVTDDSFDIFSKGYQKQQKNISKKMLLPRKKTALCF